MSRTEQETTISFNAVEDMAHICTSQPSVWRRLEKIPGVGLAGLGEQNGKITHKEFIFPKAFVRFTRAGLVIRPPTKRPPLTKRQGEALVKGRRILVSLENNQRNGRSEVCCGGKGF